jgi:hypothetical protein
MKSVRPVKPVLDKIDISRLGPQYEDSYFPEDTAHAVLFKM